MAENLTVIKRREADKRSYYKHKEARCDKSRKWNAEHKEQRASNQQRYYKRHRENQRLWARENAKKKRLSVLEYYGNKCACCDEARYEFLAIDHINGGGNAHKRQIGGFGSALVNWIIKNNYPPGFRVLCHNCNSSYGFYGYCPHNAIKT